MADEGRLIIERPVTPGSTVGLPVAAGRHQVTAHNDWTGSDPVDVDVAHDQTVRLRVEPTGASGIATLLKKKAYLRLTPVTGTAQAS